jgi:hypothetical protein
VGAGVAEVGWERVLCQNSLMTPDQRLFAGYAVLRQADIAYQFRHAYS